MQKLPKVKQGRSRNGESGRSFSYRTPRWGSGFSSLCGRTGKPIKHRTNESYLIGIQRSALEESLYSRFFRPTALHAENVRNNGVVGDAQESHPTDIVPKVSFDSFADASFHTKHAARFKVIARLLPPSPPPPQDVLSIVGYLTRPLHESFLFPPRRSKNRLSSASKEYCDANYL